MTSERTPRLSPSGVRLGCEPDCLSGPSGIEGPPGPPGPTGPTGPGIGDFLPLSNTLWVDGGTAVPLAEQDGTIARPFSTLLAGLNALSALSEPISTILITPGDYSAEGDIALISAPATDLAIVCVSAFYGIGAIAQGPQANLPGLSGGAASQFLHLLNCKFVGRNVDFAGNLVSSWCRFLGASASFLVRAGANNIANYCTTNQPLTATNGNVLARNTVFNLSGTIITSVLVAQAFFCQFSAGAIDVTFVGPPGEFQVDSFSNFYWELATETITNGTKLLVGDFTP